MPWPSHPQKHLIRHLWPDKHLYAAILLVLGAAIGAAFAVAARVVPVTFADGSPSAIAGWNWPFGIILPAIVLVLAGFSYRARNPMLGLLGAAVLVASGGALGVASLLGLASAVFFVLGRREGEHVNPATRTLHVRLWPDKALACMLLFAVAAVAAIVWGGMLLTGWMSVRGADVALWGLGSIASGLLAAVGAFLCYRQRAFAVCVIAAIGVLLSFSFILAGPALAITLGFVLLRAKGEDEFADAQPEGSVPR